MLLVLIKKTTSTIVYPEVKSLILAPTVFNVLIIFFSTHIHTFIIFIELVLPMFYSLKWQFMLIKTECFFN